MENPVLEELEHLVSEARNPASTDIDRKEIEEILRILNAEDRKIILGHIIVSCGQALYTNRIERIKSWFAF